MSAEARYLVMVTDGESAKAAAHDAERDEAWRVARELRALGQHVWIMRTDRERASSALDLDELDL